MSEWSCRLEAPTICRNAHRRGSYLLPSPARLCEPLYLEGLLEGRKEARWLVVWGLL